MAEGRSLAPLITKLNEIRRTHPALQQLRNLRFHHVDNPAITAFSKRDAVTGDTVLVLCLTEPQRVQEATVFLDLAALGLSWDSSGGRATTCASTPTRAPPTSSRSPPADSG
jgi:starch synthase (maltosyl-transferring)